MSIEVDLDALTMTWSVAGAIPQVPSGKHFQRDLVGQAAGNIRKPGPLLRLPDTPTKVNIDPRR
jgi:hypothetical protein